MWHVWGQMRHKFQQAVTQGKSGSRELKSSGQTHHEPGLLSPSSFTEDWLKGVTISTRPQGWNKTPHLRTMWESDSDPDCWKQSLCCSKSAPNPKVCLENGRRVFQRSCGQLPVHEVNLQFKLDVRVEFRVIQWFPKDAGSRHLWLLVFLASQSSTSRGFSSLNASPHCPSRSFPAATTQSPGQVTSCHLAQNNKVQN